ncbi:MAG: hypothetical protein QOH13_472, partial [Thermoleophilaceae bacterium]|nr:hypothetical protein [Thermoleophilaceae bacterium]
ILAFVFIAEMLGAVKLDWSPLANVGAALGGLVILVGSFGVLNRVRGRRFLALPERVGRTEMALFVLLPALLPVIFGGQVRSALVTMGGNALLLLAVYLVIGYGLASTIRWGIVRLLSQLALSVATLARAIPLLLLFALVLFMTTEMWQVASTVTPGVLLLIGAMLIAFGTLFLIAELPAEVRSLEREHSPAAPLSRRQRINVGLLIFTSHALQVLIVALAMGGFFVAFGAIAIRPEVLATWTGAPGHEVVAFNFLGERAVVTEELLRVAGAIAAFSGLYYAIAVLTDATYRAQFLDRLTRDLSQTFQARLRYLELRATT